MRVKLGLPTIPIPPVIPNLPTNNTQSDAPDTVVNEANDEIDRNDLEEEEEEGKPSSTAKDGGGFEEYPLCGTKHCVIINNKKFDKLKERKGSSEDVLAVEQLFRGKLGFVVHKRENLKGAQILHEIQNIKVEVEKGGVGCCVLFIMSHGDSLQQKDMCLKNR